MDPNQNADGKPNAGAPGVATLDRILAAAKGGQQTQTDQAPIAEKTIPKEFEVDVGGVKRRVPVDDLVGAYLSREQVATTKEALEKRFAELGDVQSARALQERVASLRPDQQRKVLALLQGEDDETTSVADEIDQVIPGGGDRSREPALPAEFLNRFGTLEKAVQALATRENGRMQDEHKQTVSDRVEGLMKQFPVFGDEAARKFAKGSIMTQVLAGQGEDLEKVVQKAAASLQEFVGTRENAIRDEVGAPRQMDGKPFKLKGTPKASDMTSGRLHQLAQQVLRNGARQ